MRLVLNFLGMWVAFTLAIHWLVEAGTKERISVAKAVGFGFCTATLVAVVVGVMVIFF